MLGVVDLGRQRQPQAQQRIEKPMLVELASSRHNTEVSATERSGIVRLWRQAEQRGSAASASISQLQASYLALSQNRSGRSGWANAVHHPPSGSTAEIVNT